jgi:putative ABC transport system permease protein
MLRNYLLSTLRQVRKHKLFFLINVLGLSIGIATVVLIYIYIHFEFSFDKGMKHYENLYRVCWETTLGGVNNIRPASPPPLCSTFIEEFPEVVNGVRLYNNEETIVKLEDKIFCESNFYYADSTFFELFSIPLISGKKGKLLTKPNTIVLTESTAHKLFGEENALGKNISLQDETNFEVVGICEDIPKTYHLDIDYIASMKTSRWSDVTSWPSNPFQTYLLLGEGASIENLEEKIPSLVKQHMESAIRGIMNISFDEFIAGGSNYAYHLQAVKDIHLRSEMSEDYAKRSSLRNIYIFMIVALLVLSLAIINYVNLSSAKGMERAKEIGVRKIVGATRSEIIKQFLGESILITFISTILGLMLVEIALPYINSVMNLTLSVGYFDNVFVIPSLSGFILVLGVFSGLYPAFVISLYNPLSLFHKESKSSKKGIGFKSLLIVFQYFISFILIIATIVVFEQLNFMRDKELGFDDEQVLVLQKTHVLGPSSHSFKEELSKEAFVKTVSSSKTVPGKDVSTAFMYNEDDSEDEIVTPMVIGVDHDFIKCYDIKLIQGRCFDLNRRSDSTALIVNKAAVKAYGLNEPLNSAYFVSGNKHYGAFKIIGVVEDFHFESLHENIKPCFLHIDGQSDYISIKLETESISETINQIEKKWNSFTDSPFDYFFIDQQFDALYKQENLMRKIFTIFTVLSIFIASIGLFGIVLFTTEKRTKEIGIRKVLGASRKTILKLFISQYLIWIGISVVLGVPVAWWATTKWLQQFAFRISFHFGFILVAIILLLIITLVTIYSRISHVSKQNPVNALRYE